MDEATVTASETATSREFYDALGEHKFIGIDMGGDWNGFANVLVPEPEADRMIATWRREALGAKNWPAYNGLHPTYEQILEELGYDEASLPLVRSYTVNGQKIRARDFSCGYAFEWADEE